MTVIEIAPGSAARLGSIEVHGRLPNEYVELLTPRATSFLAALSRRFEGRRCDLLRARGLRQHQIDHGWLPDFPHETSWVRERDWTVAPIPPDLLDRRVEISGPVDRKSVVTALNSGAKVYMADFEDGTSPTWDNIMRGQVNLRDAVEGSIGYEGPNGEFHRLSARTAAIAVRPRGWHLAERHVQIEGRPISASLFDFGLFLFHNGKKLLDKRATPHVYLPKIEHYFEARLWNDVFMFAQECLGLPSGSLRATVIIENALAAFQMDEILYELRDHAAGLRHGRWDYIFSFIKQFRHAPASVLPDRRAITMDQGFLKASAALLVRTCHRRGIHAIGGKATQDPVHCDPSLKSVQFEEVLENMLREVAEGHDGTQVVHPGLVPFGQGVFDAGMPTLNQIDRSRDDVTIAPGDLLDVPAAPVTRVALIDNIQITLRYLTAWLSGRGMIAHGGLLENAGSAEICRAQVWQWRRHRTRLEDGTPVTPELVVDIIEHEAESIRREQGAAVSAAERLDLATAITRRVVLADDFPDFMTQIADEYLA